MRRFLRENSLSLVLFGIFFLILIGQFFTGYNTNNDNLQEHGQPTLSYSQYIISGHFIEAIGENWESEFLQMGAYVLLTIWLRQKGASESKPLQGQTESDRTPGRARKGAPWPVRRGGWILKLYENSLSIALLVFFLLSFGIHAYGGARVYCVEQLQHGQECLSTLQFMGTSQFWFQSFQNWQSEFLSMGVLIVLSIYLRQKGSPESKPVDAAHDATGEE